MALPAVSNPPALGVTPVSNGVDIAVVAPHASAVEFCTFASYDPNAAETRLRLHGPHEGVFSGHVAGIGPGTAYGFRAWGPWEPEKAMVYNPNKLLLDPYAKAITGKIELNSAVHAHQTDAELYPLQPLRPNPENSAPYTVRGVITGPSFEVAARPATKWEDTVIYEAHVRGLTENLPGVPAHLRGTYAGLAHPATIGYLKKLGITALELLPINAKFDEPFLAERGLTNYWGYSPLSYFAPEPSLATAASREAGPGAVVDEVRGMISILHEAGIEVILDVVYNHTCEGGLGGQSLSLRGLDEAEYYLFEHGDKFSDVTGCGNSLDASSSRVQQLILDSLRYWVSQMGVDGFRFDLAVTIGRFGPHFSPTHPILAALATDPVLAGIKMIAEPWDVGYGGWQTGNFLRPFSTWNDRFRDCVRTFWVADAGAQASRTSRGSAPHDLATRLSGSADLYYRDNPAQNLGTRASVNFICAHDGFTLADLVSFNQKHNEANLEENRDGTENNLSWNHGLEAPISLPTADIRASSNGGSQVIALMEDRLKTMRNLLGTLFVSAGTPMLVAGDEFGRTQKGNNNAYCQDNEISWLNWDLASWQQELQETVTHLISLRKRYPAMRPASFLTGSNLEGDPIADLAWYDHQALAMTEHTWHDPAGRAFQMLRSGRPYNSNDVLVCFNGLDQDITFTLPNGRGSFWRLMWDSTVSKPRSLVDLDNEVPEVESPSAKTVLASLSMQIYISR
ncbi:glycogen debranching enzyme [Actinomyces sp. HMSC06A08]|nr:glycogen debranching enzyme [Actinomyces sp. HMSC072A03]OFT55516.1 glycogen debranching enzyme [Actinomyces sp. HMSC06A08]